MTLKWRYSVTLECDNMTSPDCHRSLTHASTMGPGDARDQLLAQARLAQWSADDPEYAICPACRASVPETGGRRTI